MLKYIQLRENNLKNYLSRKMSKISMYNNYDLRV